MRNKYNTTVEESDKDVATSLMGYEDFLEIYGDMNTQLQMESFVMWAQVNE